jgi:hypothetical protein
VLSDFQILSGFTAGTPPPPLFFEKSVRCGLVGALFADLGLGAGDLAFKTRYIGFEFRDTPIGQILGFDQFMARFEFVEFHSSLPCEVASL